MPSTGQAAVHYSLEKLSVLFEVSKGGEAQTLACDIANLLLAGTQRPAVTPHSARLAQEMCEKPGSIPTWCKLHDLYNRLANQALPLRLTHSNLLGVSLPHIIRVCTSSLRKLTEKISLIALYLTLFICSI